MSYHTDQYISRIVGKLLGDGSITKQVGRKPRFQFMHSVADFDWTKYCYEQLKDFLPLNPPMYKKIVDKRIKSGFSESYFVQSRIHEFITLLEEMWYINRKKQLPISFINEYLNEESLAWWYQDDGHLKQEKGIARKIILSTDNFATDENLKLIEILNKKFHLTFSIDGQNRLILYDQYQILYFLRLLEPYIHTSMNRKQLDQGLQKTLASTTTIYLPTTFQLNKPTSEINNKLNKLNILMELIKTRKGHISFYYENLWIQKKILTNPYRIRIANNHRENLLKIRSILGLTNSKIIEWCFRS
ncbi:endonuclease [Lederbergia panacisoli]|uniref:endonuclease n=1 Tax=Lederbergia panacisoli TaxID=1255251 RepID=UPI00214B5096|nr:endonuclease [Lederbergia panacisoli]MCR2822365.1 endonuclease [Lederbergia panacisoli]